MNVFIPPLGTKLELTQPWTFTVCSEYRNDAFIDVLRHEGYRIPDRTVSPSSYYHSTQTLGTVTLPVGTLLTMKRIYVRQGQKGFDSVTFQVKIDLVDPSLAKPVMAAGRIWVKLDEVNTIEAKVL